MGLNPKIFPKLTRAGLINREAQFDNNTLVEFVSQELYFETEAQISVLALNEGYKRWSLLKGELKSNYLFDLSIDIAAIALSVFDRRIIKERKPHFDRKTTVLVGVRWREATDPCQDRGMYSVVLDYDIWESLRAIPDKPLYEISDYKSDFVKSNQTIPHGKNRMTPDPKLPTTEIQKKFLQNITSASPKEKKVQKKPVLIFAPSQVKQFPLPERPSDKKLKVTKFTSKMAEKEFLDKPLPIHLPSYLLQSFKKVRKLFLNTIATPLRHTQMEGYFKYHPHLPFGQTEIARERISYLARLGNITYLYDRLLGGRKVIWCNSLRDAQIKFPSPVGKSPNSQNLFQSKKNFTGHLFPIRYFWDNEGSPRLKSYPGYTIRDCHNGFRKEIFKNFSKHSGMYLYDCDLSSCHPRVIMMFLTADQAPLLHKSFAVKDLYLEIAKDLQLKYPILKIIPISLLRKIIKIKTLAMLNGGGLRTENHISDLLALVHPKGSDEFKALMKVLINILAELPIVLEFKSHGNFISSEKEVFIPSHSGKITSSGSNHILASPCICAVESFTMTYLIEYIAVCRFEILPLTSIHDGLNRASPKELSLADLEEFDLGFATFVEAKRGIPLPIETIPINESY